MIRKFNLHRFNEDNTKFLFEFWGPEEIGDRIVAALQEAVTTQVRKPGYTITVFEPQQDEPVKRRIYLTKTKILDAFDKTGGAISAAAGYLGIEQKDLMARMKRHGIVWDENRRTTRPTLASV